MMKKMILAAITSVAVVIGIIMIDNNNNALSFKHSKTVDSKIISELSNIDFNSNYNLSKYHISNLSQLEYSQFKRIFPFIDKIFFQEISARLKDSISPNIILNQLQLTIDKILDDDVAVFYDNFAGKTYFMPDSFLFSENVGNKEIANNYNDAIQLLFKIKYKNERIKSLKNQIRKHLDKELNRLAYKLNNLSGRIEKGSRENYYYKSGNLLLANINLLKKGMEEIQLPDYENNSEIFIPLNPKLLPNKNVDKYFEKARDEKINFQKSRELFEKTERKYNSLLNLKTKFDTISTIEDLENMASSLKLKKDSKVKKKMINTIKFRHYIIEDKYNVFVGKDSKSNDLLSIKFAKQNDYWFHARGLPGSHVVLRVENTKEGVPKNIIKNAASIAGYFSKAKTAKVAPVSYTFAKFVYKKKGMEPGKVMISKEKVLLVKPEIPKNCEIVNDD